VIVFVPAYDGATNANRAVAQDLPAAAHRLLGADATREALLDALAAHEGPLFAMAHGSNDRLRAHAHRTALEAADAPVLGCRAAFAFACHTSAWLGREFAREGVTWWGYIKEVTAPDHREPFRSLFVAIFSWVYQTFATTVSIEDRRDALVYLKQMCDEAAISVDEAAEADPLLDVMETVQSLRDIWQLLHVWSAHAESAQTHPHAPPIIPLRGL
jgi:hypothetical protein